MGRVTGRARWLTVCATAVVVTSGCAGQTPNASAIREPSATSVCFEVTDDGHQLGQLLEHFFLEGKGVQGTTGYQITAFGKHSFVRFDLEAGLDPATWITSLPSLVTDDPIITSIEPTGGTGCG